MQPLDVPEGEVEPAAQRAVDGGLDLIAGDRRADSITGATLTPGHLEEALEDAPDAAPGALVEALEDRAAALGVLEVGQPRAEVDIVRPEPHVLIARAAGERVGERPGGDQDARVEPLLALAPERVGIERQPVLPQEFAPGGLLELLDRFEQRGLQHRSSPRGALQLGRDLRGARDRDLDAHLARPRVGGG